MRTACLILALAALAFAAGSLPGIPDGPTCLYAGTDIGITADPQGNCPSVTTWRLSQAEPVISAGKYSYLHCQYERKRNGEPAIDLGNMREEFVVTGPCGTMYDAAAAFVKSVGILPHGYIHRISMVKRISK